MSDVVIWDNHSHVAVEEGERHPKDKTMDEIVTLSFRTIVREPHSPLHLRSGPWEGSPGESDAFLRSIICQPWGVLGAGITAEKKLHHDGPDPTEMPSVCICDPAGLHHIQPPGGPKVRGSS